MGTFDVVPTPLEVEADLKQIVHNLKRWEALPLRALRALPSVRFWIPPPAEQAHPEEQSVRAVSNAAIRQRIEEAIARTALKEDQKTLASLFTFADPANKVKVRHEAAAKHQGVTTETFRKYSEPKLLRQFAEELFRGELEWGGRQRRVS